MCFQAFCLEIICSDPQEVLQAFLFENSLTKNAEHFVFLSFKPQPFLSFHASWYLHVLLVEAGVSDAVLISLSSDDCFPPVQWALHWFPFQHTLAHVLIHQLEK